MLGQNVPMDLNLTTILVAAASGGGGVLIVREVIGGLFKLGRGVAGRVNTRQADIVTQLARANDRADDAEADKEAAEARFDIERKNRRNVEVYAWGLERLLIRHEIDYKTVGQPTIEDTTLSHAEVQKIRGESSA